MVQQQIESLKRQFTDKYVLVDASRPELARFRDVVGRVKTVNMSGRALVEFDDYHLNIGWYDIAPEFLKIVDKPPPKPPKAEAKKAPAKAAPKPAPAKAAAAPAAAKGGKPSVADILAAARAGKAGGAAAPAQTPAEQSPPAEAHAKAESPGEPAKVDRSKMSVADMLAAARAGGAAGIVPAKVKSESAPPSSEPAAPPAPAEPPEPVAEPAPAAESEAAEAPSAEPAAEAGEVTRVDKSGMSIDEMLAYCREHDAS